MNNNTSSKTVKEKKVTKGNKANTQPVKLVLHTLKYFYKEALRYKPAYFIFIIVMILINGLGPFVNILLPKLIIDELTGARDIHRIIIIVLIIIFSNLFFTASKWVVMMILDKYADGFERYYKVKLSDKAMTMDFEHTENPEVLEQQSRAETGMSWYSGGIHGLTVCFTDIIAAVITLLGVIAIVVISSPNLLTIIIISVILRMFLNTKRNSIDVKFFKGLVAINRAFGYVFWQLSEFRFGKDIRLYGAKKMMLTKAEGYNDKLAEELKAQAMEKLPYEETDVAVHTISDGFIFFYLGFLAIKKIITIGDFNMLTTAAGSFTASLWGIISNLQEIHKRSTFMKEFITFMDYKDALSKGSQTNPDTGDYEFEFRNVSFKYPRSEEYALQNVNLKISSKEHLSVVGLNGAGKTTFIKLLCRLYDVTEGEILLNGVDIKDYDPVEYGKLFAVVFQDYKLFGFSIKENIILDSGGRDVLPEKRNETKNPEKAEDLLEVSQVDEELKELCSLCGLSDKVDSLEHGLDTIIYKQFDEEGIEPSGGEAQKIAIARALYKNAPVVILDEPTAALDPIAEYEIYQHFNHLVGGKTAVYISHRLSSCKFCDKIAVFSKQTVAEYGNHEELVRLPGGIYSEMFAAQAQYYT